MNKIGVVTFFAALLALAGAGCNLPNNNSTAVNAPVNNKTAAETAERATEGDNSFAEGSDEDKARDLVLVAKAGLGAPAVGIDAKVTTSPGALAGRYEDYAPAKLALAETGKVVLFFKATWCPTCRSLDLDILKNLNAIPSNVAILKVDYDSAAELKKKYGVTYQHTFVQVDASGQLIAKWSGSPTLAALLSQIK